MSLVNGSLHVIGAFYVFAGIVGARAAVVGQTIDRMVAALDRAVEGESGGPEPAAAKRITGGQTAAERASRVRGAWMLAGSLAVLIAGATLLLRLGWACAAFPAAALLQAVYLFYLAPVHLDTADPIDAEGRRQTSNAFGLFCLATLYVVWAGLSGHLLPIAAARPEAVGVVALLCTGFIGYTLWSYARPLPSDGDDPR